MGARGSLIRGNWSTIAGKPLDFRSNVASHPDDSFMPKRFLAHLTGYLFALGSVVPAQAAGPAEVAIGERLFLETRFSQFFAVQSAGNANVPFASGDPTVEKTVTLDEPAPGPFAGQAMNCRACHFVDEHSSTLKNRTYADFARRSPIPPRIDGLTLTVRNSPALVNSSPSRRGGTLMHFDGEFFNGRELAIATLTGRNFGWLASENAAAIAHVAHIIRADDGTGELAQKFGGSYAEVLAGADAVPAGLRLPKAYRIDVTKAADEQILRTLGRLLEAYMKSLTFALDERGQFNGSPYDVFLEKNGLPRKPRRGESESAYVRRLFAQINTITTPLWVSNDDRTFGIHDQDFVFGPSEFKGLKVFFTGSGVEPAAVATVASGGAGNCVSCHIPPTFSDFGFHNTGATQEEYDSLHGAGAFVALTIPTLAERRQNPEDFLPRSYKRPGAMGTFSTIPEATSPNRTDLGLWNIFANPDHPRSQAAILRSLKQRGSKAVLLPLTIGRFKTPGLRDLADSAPYLHNGSKDTLEDVLEFYKTFSDLARAGEVRNPAPESLGIALVPQDIELLAAFLRSLNEDYE